MSREACGLWSSRVREMALRARCRSHLVLVMERRRQQVQLLAWGQCTQQGSCQRLVLQRLWQQCCGTRGRWERRLCWLLWQQVVSHRKSARPWLERHLLLLVHREDTQLACEAYHGWRFFSALRRASREAETRRLQFRLQYVGAGACLQAWMCALAHRQRLSRCVAMLVKRRRWRWLCKVVEALGLCRRRRLCAEVETKALDCVLLRGRLFRCASSSFRAWAGFIGEVSRRKEIGRRIVLRWQRTQVAVPLITWIAMVECRKLLRRIGRTGIARWNLLHLAAPFRRLRANVEESVRLKHVAGKVVRRGQRLKLAAAFDCLLARSSQQQRGRRLCCCFARRMRLLIVARSWQRWTTSLDSRAHIRSSLHELLAQWRLLRALRSWAGHVTFQLYSARVVSKGERRSRSRRLSDVCGAWFEQTAEKRAMLRRCDRLSQRRKSFSAKCCLSELRSAAAASSRRRALMSLAVGRLRQRLVFAALSTWGDTTHTARDDAANACIRFQRGAQRKSLVHALSCWIESARGICCQCGSTIQMPCHLRPATPSSPPPPPPSRTQPSSDMQSRSGERERERDWRRDSARSSPRVGNVGAALYASPYPEHTVLGGFLGRATRESYDIMKCMVDDDRHARARERESERESERECV